MNLSKIHSPVAHLLILAMLFSAILPSGIAFAKSSDTGNECKNFEKHLEQYGEYSEMPSGLQKVYADCDGAGNPATQPQNNGNNNDNGTPAINTGDENCEWVDDLGRPRKDWHKDVKDGKPLNLYKRCYAATGSDAYTNDNPQSRYRLSYHRLLRPYYGVFESARQNL